MKRMFFIVVLFSLGIIAASFAEQKRPIPVSPAKAAQDTIAKKATVAMHYGKISLSTTPDSAEITLDSIAKPLSPCILDSIVPGTHVIIAKRKGFYGKKITLDVTADSTIKLEIAFVKPASLFVSTTPAGAHVLFDGNDAGSTPYENTRVKLGKHVVRIEKDQFGAVETSYNAVDGKTDSLVFALQPLPVKPAQALQQKPADIVPDHKQGLDKTLLIILTSVFVVFGIAVFAVESGSN